MKVVSQGNRDSGNGKAGGFDGGLNFKNGDRNKNRRVKVIERRPNDDEFEKSKSQTINNQKYEG